LAGDIAGHGGQFDIRVFERLLDAIDQPGSIGCQTTAVARQVPQFPLGTRRHKACPQQTMLEQVGDPFLLYALFSLCATKQEQLVRALFHLWWCASGA